MQEKLEKIHNLQSKKLFLLGPSHFYQSKLSEVKVCPSIYIYVIHFALGINRNQLGGRHLKSSTNKRKDGGGGTPKPISLQSIGGHYLI